MKCGGMQERVAGAQLAARFEALQPRGLVHVVLSLAPRDTAQEAVDDSRKAWKRWAKPVKNRWRALHLQPNGHGGWRVHFHVVMLDSDLPSSIDRWVKLTGADYDHQRVIGLVTPLHARRLGFYLVRRQAWELGKAGTSDIVEGYKALAGVHVHRGDGLLFAGWRARAQQVERPPAGTAGPLVAPDQAGNVSTEVGDVVAQAGDVGPDALQLGLDLADPERSEHEGEQPAAQESEFIESKLHAEKVATHAQKVERWHRHPLPDRVWLTRAPDAFAVDEKAFAAAWARHLEAISEAMGADEVDLEVDGQTSCARRALAIVMGVVVGVLIALLAGGP